MIPLKVALLWHHHQPLYKSPRSNRYSLPWVRLHGLKDYYDMAALAAEFPDLRLTFNLVPSLVDQLDDYAEGRAADPALDLARRDPADLGDDERLAMLDLFFSAPYRTLIAPFPRYAALFHKRGRRGAAGDHRESLGDFGSEDLRDLQVWFHLAWCGTTLRRDALVRDLIRKGSGFTEEEKRDLLDREGRFLREILPIHQRLADDGVAEIATSPYYHPILPLLCDQASSREAVPDLPLPDPPFTFPTDAAWQVRAALSSMERRFGRTPRGMWPSEGALSERVVALLGECGVRWTASDEDVLRASAPGPHGADLLYRPYRLDAAGEQGPVIFFRDHALSDLIGFTYSTWQGTAAAADMLARLRGIAHRAPGGVVSVILDGENAWEHYADNGAGFLRALYHGLTQSEEFRTVTFSQALEESDAVARLPRLRAGSWIGANFNTWIGHPEKNRAWSLLAVARREAARRMGDRLEDSPAFASLTAAEGSDWFWWFGEDHSSEQDAIFDESFRDLLRGVYLAIDAPAPADLSEPIKRARPHVWSRPTGPVRAELDGRVTDYFEWLAAGECDALAGQGAMHQTTGLIRRIAYGTSGGALYVRVDPERGDVAGMLESLGEGSVLVEVVAPSRRVAAVGVREGRVIPLSDPPVRFAAGKVLEVELELPAAPVIELQVTLRARDGVVQRLPRGGTIEVPTGDPTDWSV